MTGTPFLTRLGRKAADLLSDSSESPRSPLTDAFGAATAKTPGKPATKPPRQAALDPSFDNQLRAALLQHRGLLGSGGAVNFVSLAKIQERMGDKWEKMAAKADEVTRQTIEHRLAPVDVFTRANSLNYLILFPQLTKAQAQLKCALIAEEITQRLLGNDFSGDLLEVKSAVVNQQGEIMLETAPRLADLAASLFEADPTEEKDEEAPGGGAGVGDQNPMANTRLVYRPMWDVRQNTLATYICVPAVEQPNDGIVIGESAVPEIDRPEIAFDLDKLALQRVIQDLRSLRETGRKLLLIAPVHFETIAARARRDLYLQMCQAIPSASRQLIIFELVGVPETIPPGRLLDLAVQFRRLARAVILRMPITHATFLPPAETGVFAVGADISGMNQAEVEIIRHMERFVASASKKGLRTYVHGLGSVSLTTSATGAGFDYIDGDVITAVVEAPRDAYRFEARNIYANPFRRDAKQNP